MKKLPFNVEIVAALGGGFMLLINGFQAGGQIDSSGAGDMVYKTRQEAANAYAKAEGK